MNNPSSTNPDENQFLLEGFSTDEGWIVVDGNAVRVHDVESSSVSGEIDPRLLQEVSTGAATGVRIDRKAQLQSKMDSILRRLFSFGSQESFEHGVQSDFSKQLTIFIYIYGAAGLERLRLGLWREDTPREIFAESLKTLGEMRDRQTQINRRLIIVESLLCDSPRVRDAACIALQHLNDPSTKRFIESAIRTESVDWIKNDLRQTLADL